MRQRKIIFQLKILYWIDWLLSGRDSADKTLLESIDEANPDLPFLEVYAVYYAVAGRHFNSN